MITTDNIGFKLTIREPGLRGSRTVVVCPRYEGLKIRESRPSGKKYFQKELAGTLKLTGVDFRQVYGCALRTKFTLVVYMRGRGEVARCYFRKTDCKWDVNHEICEVDVSAWNPYKRIESGRDNEYNLVNMGLDKHPMSFYQYPTRQIYVEGAPELAIFSHTEPNLQNIEAVENAGKLSQDMRFGSYARLKVVLISNDLGYFINTFVGECVAVRIPSFPADIWGFSLTANDGNTTLTLNYNGSELTGSMTSGNVSALMTTESGSIDYVTRQTTLTFSRNTVIQPAPTTFDVKVRFYLTFSRLAVPIVVSGHELQDDDIYRGQNASGLGLTQSEAVAGWPHIEISTRTSATDKGYGKVENTQRYYDTPDDTNKWWPVWKDSWFEGKSLWVGENWPTILDQRDYRKQATVDDFYLLGDAIKAVVHEIDPDLHFECDTDHSQFLFDTTNPVSQLGQGNLYISQKSNILNLGYDYPAWQAPITWGKIETLLNNAFNCYWDIYEENGERHLRIEHYVFYDGAFGYNAQMSLSRQHDLKAAYRNSTPYTYADKTNRWEWDKGNERGSANRYEYGWMDTQSAMFDGQAVEVPEEYQLFEDTNVEERRVDWFSTDIDFLVSVSAECSSDGFILVMEGNDGWVRVDNTNINNLFGYYITNYQLSFEYLQTVARYLFAGMYSNTLKVGDTTYNNVNNYTARMRKAEVQFRLVEGDTMAGGDEVITEVGQGVAENVELDMSSGLYTATLRYKNE